MISIKHQEKNNSQPGIETQENYHSRTNAQYRYCWMNKNGESVTQRVPLK